MHDRAMKEAIRGKREKNVVDHNVENDEASNHLSGMGNKADGELRSKQNLHTDPRDHLTDTHHQLVDATQPNEGRQMSGDGADPQHDNMGVDDKAPLHEQGGSLTKKLHSQTSRLKADVQSDVGDDMDSDISDPGKGEDVQEAMSTRHPEQHPMHDNNAQAKSYVQRGKPMAAARERMKAMFAKRK